MPYPGTSAGNRAASDGSPTRRAAGMIEGRAWPSRAAAGHREPPVLPTGRLWRTGRLAALPLRHAARTAAAATRLSRAAADQIAARTAEQIFGALASATASAAATACSAALTRPRRERVLVSRRAGVRHVS